MSDDESQLLLSPETDKIKIREELSNMSFEDLKKLQEKLGSKMYKKVMFGETKVKKPEIKRLNKNRPREMSAKNPVPMYRESFNKKQQNAPRDPRFDSLCGTFDEKAFKKNYKFIDELKKNDVVSLKKELKHEQDPKRIKKIKYLIQRLENQLREQVRKEKKIEADLAEKLNIVEAIKNGEKPQYKKKSERKILDLVSQYEELKNTGKLKKHIERLRKKRTGQDRKRFGRDNDATSGGEMQL